MRFAAVVRMFGLFAAVGACCGGSASAQDRAVPRLHTNEAYVAEVSAASNLDVGDPMAVFAYVLGSLPDRVKVYPTENHYYFSFLHAGLRYAGNIKIDARTRDKGAVHFVYYEDTAVAPESGGAGFELTLDRSRGVVVEKAGPLAYSLTLGDKRVVFELNDLSAVKPPASVVAPDEEFIGPIFDESGVRFFLMFNARLKIFLYILDETVKPVDAFVAAAKNDRILVGKRTGFALYRDGRLERKILIGALAANIDTNSYFDGPFDQMPDNFHQGDAFRQALYAVNPDLRGRIDRFGAFADGSRYAIVTYLSYRRAEDLNVFHRCATSGRVAPANYYQCFVIEEDNRGSGSPMALRRAR